MAEAQRKMIASRTGLTWAAYAVFGARPRNSAGAVRVSGIEP